MMNEKLLENANSPFAQEVQGSVAKLLSKENVTVHRSVSYRTAFFDVEKRLLGLPVIENVPKDVYDLFIGHEVGHALWSTMDNLKTFVDKYKSKMLYNVLEDIRIEKKIQLAYPGLIVSFRNGYMYLFFKEFFGKTDQKTIDSLKLIDRINILAKLGPQNVKPAFSPEEQPIVDAAMSVQTHEDVCRVADMILEHIRKKKEETKAEEDQGKPKPQSKGDQPEDTGPVNDMPDDGSEADSGQEQSSSESEEDGDGEDSNVDSDKDDPTGSDQSQTETQQEPGGEQGNSELDSDTQKNFEESIDRNRISESSPSSKSKDFQFVEPSKNNIENATVTYQEILKYRDNCKIYRASVNDYNLYEHIKRFETELRDTRKKVAILRSEFEQKKAAFQYTRARTSRRGIIDVNRIHRYKFSEDIFSSITTLAEAQSHGMVFLVDWSGSMHCHLDGVIKKLMVVVEFCKSLNIPFEVYSFTTMHESFAKRKHSHDRCIPNKDEIDVQDLKFIQVLSSKMSKAVYLRALKDLYIIGALSRVHRGHHLSGFEAMGSTPLLEAIVLSHQVIKQFKAENNIQIVNFIVLSDGVGGALNFCRRTHVNYDSTVPFNDRISTGYGSLFGGKRFMLEATNAHIRSSKSVYHRNLRALLKNIKDTYRANTLCFFVCESSRTIQLAAEQLAGDSFEMDAKGPFVSAYSSPECIALRKKLKESIAKNLICSVDDMFGYDKYILMANSKSVSRRKPGSMIQSEDEDYDSFGEYELEYGCSESDIKREFIKYSKGNKSAKIFANEFIETISANF